MEVKKPLRLYRTYDMSETKKRRRSNVSWVLFFLTIIIYSARQITYDHDTHAESRVRGGRSRETKSVEGGGARKQVPPPLVSLLIMIMNTRMNYE